MSILSRSFLLCLLLIAVNSLTPASAGILSKPFVGDVIPIVLSAEVPPGSAGTCTVSVSIQVNQVGDAIQIGCDQPSLVNSPSNSWPYVYSYASGTSTTRTFTFTTNYMAQNTTVHVYACPTGVDSSVSSNWSVSKTIILPASGPMLALSRSVVRPGVAAAIVDNLPALARLRGGSCLSTDRTKSMKSVRGDVGRSIAYSSSLRPAAMIIVRPRVDLRTGARG